MALQSIALPSVFLAFALLLPLQQAVGMPLAQPAGLGSPSVATPAATPTAAPPVYVLGFDITSINKLPNWAFNLTILGLVLVIILLLLAVVFAGRFVARRWKRSARVATELAEGKKGTSTA